MKHLTLCITTMHPEIAQKCVESAVAHGRTDFSIAIFGNALETIDEGFDFLEEVAEVDVEVANKAPAKKKPATGATKKGGKRTTRRTKKIHTEHEFLVDTSATNLGVPGAMHQLWQLCHRLANEQLRDNEKIWPSVENNEDHIICYVHDDVTILEDGWDERVMAAFEDKKVGLAGFGGSTGIGADNIYRKAYEKSDLGRINFFSNMENAEANGTRVKKEKPIVWTDGFSMILRRKVLDTINGWSWWPADIPHHAYDYAIACWVRRLGMTGVLVPCKVEHNGGTTVLREKYQALVDDARSHDESHRFVYDTFRDVLPLRV